MAPCTSVVSTILSVNGSGTFAAAASATGLADGTSAGASLVAHPRKPRDRTTSNDATTCIIVYFLIIPASFVACVVIDRTGYSAAFPVVKRKSNAGSLPRWISC